MKALLFGTIVTIMLAGCTSLPPERSTAGWPVKSITVPAEQSVTFPQVGHPVVTLPAARYALAHENKFAWYYSRPALVIVRRDMLITFREEGGIGCTKKGGRLFVYRTPRQDTSGELVKYFAKKELGETDDISRLVTGYLTEGDVTAWKFEANQMPEPTAASGRGSS